MHYVRCLDKLDMTDSVMIKESVKQWTRKQVNKTTRTELT